MSVEVAADTWEGRQKAGVVLIGFSLRDPAALGIRVEGENGSEPKLGQMERRGRDWEIALSPIFRVGSMTRRRMGGFQRGNRVGRYGPIELKFPSESPVS